MGDMRPESPLRLISAAVDCLTQIAENPEVDLSCGEGPGRPRGGAGMRRRKPDEAACARCGGIGYLMRLTDKAMVKCLVCSGTGRTAT